jgi:hypothetical protein
MGATIVAYRVNVQQSPLSVAERAVDTKRNEIICLLPSHGSIFHNRCISNCAAASEHMFSDPVIVRHLPGSGRSTIWPEFRGFVFGGNSCAGGDRPGVCDHYARCGQGTPLSGRREIYGRSIFRSGYRSS